MKKKLKNTIIFTGILYLFLHFYIICAFAFYWLTFNPIKWSEDARGAFSLISIVILIFAVFVFIVNANNE